MNRPLAFLGLALGLGALLLQFGLTISARTIAGENVFGALAFYFSFFTILTNIAVTLVYAAQAFPTAPLGAFRKRRVQGMLVAAIAFVGIFYYALMREIWAPEGLWLLADILLHYVAPIAYILYWAVFLADGTLKFRHVGPWLLVPVVYLAYVYARGLTTGLYPYEMLDLGPHGWGPVLPRIIGLFFAFLALGLVVVAIDKIKRRLARRPQQSAS